MDSLPLERRLKDEACRLGFQDAGIAAAEPTAHGALLRHWLEEGYAGEMTYLGREDAVARRLDLELTLPGVQSALVVAHHYPAEDPPGIPGDPSKGVIARYARGRDYHKVVHGKLRELGRWLEGELEAPPSSPPVSGGGPGGAAEAPTPTHRVYVDTGPILERDLARRAGLGWFGRNTMLIHPRRGSYFFLGVLLTTAKLTPDPPFEADRCGSCRACLDACPTGALLGRDETGAPVMDARRCISYLTIEQKGPIPEELRPLMGNRVYGCDICQEVCPWNVRFAEEAAEPGYAARGAGERPIGVEPVKGVDSVPGEDVSAETHADVSAETRGFGNPAHPGTKAPSLVALMQMTHEDWDAFSRGSAIRRAGFAGFKRNVAVAMGNWLASVEEPPEEAVAVLREALEDDEPLVREHAAWALGRVDSVEASP